MSKRSVSIENTGRLRAAQIFFRVAAAIALLCAPALGGCSFSMPIASLKANVDEDVTGSIAKSTAPISPLSKRLDWEDWRRARAAMGVALDPQGNGATVAWDNPQTGRRGSFVPVASAYPVDGQVCRAFVAKIDGGDSKEQVQGAACRIGGTDDWDVQDVKPFKDG
jgi:surface antigen